MKQSLFSRLRDTNLRLTVSTIAKCRAERVGGFWRKHGHSSTEQRRCPRRDSRAAGKEWPSHPDSRFPLPFIFPMGASGYLPCMWREQGGPRLHQGFPLLKHGIFSWL